MIRNGKQYSLTYDDRRLPKHYGWKTDSKVVELTADYEKFLKENRSRQADAISRMAVESTLHSLDKNGRWISRYDGKPLVGQPKMKLDERYLSSEVFSRNVSRLSEFLIQNR